CPPPRQREAPGSRSDPLRRCSEYPSRFGPHRVRPKGLHTAHWILPEISDRDRPLGGCPRIPKARPDDFPDRAPPQAHRTVSSLGAGGRGPVPHVRETDGSPGRRRKIAMAKRIPQDEKPFNPIESALVERVTGPAVPQPAVTPATPAAAKRPPREKR